MLKTTPKQQKFYFSNRLKKQMDQIVQHPLTIVEAPSGFGKTTAIREYLRSEHPGAISVWYTCLGKSAAAAWAQMCDLLAGINRKAADELKKLKYPQEETLHYIRSAFKKLKTKKDIFFVIDNYQRAQFGLHRELVETLSMHENPNVHIILITQQLDFIRKLPLHRDNIYRMDATSFFFDRDGIASLFRMEGLRLTEKELDDIYDRTEGWIAAIRLQMLYYKETGSFVGTSGIEQLVKTAIWDTLKPGEKDFLLAVSVCDSFTVRQAAYMLDYDVLPGAIEERLKASGFIRYLPEQRVFIIHSLLLDYLRNRFNYHLPQEYQRKLLHKAGLAYADMGDYCLAAKFFYDAKDYEAILSLPVTLQYIDQHKSVLAGLPVKTFIRECPDELYCKYPSNAATNAYYSLMNGDVESYKRLYDLLHTLIQSKTELSQEEMRISSELIMLKVFENFNDIPKMQEYLGRLAELWKDRPEIGENSIPGTYFFLTTVGMLWRDPGTLNDLLDAMDKEKSLRLTGACIQAVSLLQLFRTEVALLRGDDNAAEIFCHRALDEARENRQPSNSIYAQFCFARIFILRGDADNFLVAFKSIQTYITTEESPAIRHMASLCLSIISLMLDMKDYVAPWLYDMDSIRNALYLPMLPFAEILHFGLLFIDKRYQELYALIPLAMERLDRLSDLNIRYRIPQLYHNIFLAVARYRNGEREEARHYIKEALDIALPDEIYLPFADHACMRDLLPAGDRFTALRAICERQQNGVNIIRKEFLRSQSPLTPREREIALLAKERLTTKEIAAKLYISVATVSWTLTNVYSKLGIHSKSELMSVEF